MTPPPRSLVTPPPPAEPFAGAEPTEPTPFATFPVELAFALTTTDDLDDDVKVDRAVDGTGRARSFYSSPKHAINATLAGLTSEEWVVFDAFYRANRAVPFTVPWGECGNLFDLPVLFASPPKRTFHGNHLSTVSFQLVEFP